jgi:hypothetical protein
MIRFGVSLINKTFENINKTGAKAVSIKCAQENENQYSDLFSMG